LALGGALPQVDDQTIADYHHRGMTTPPTPSQLASLDDERLEQLAVSWRAQALRGDRRAFGVAHAFEVERRRRLSASQLQQLEPLASLAPRKPWWKFW
jgi:3-methyladenine DNA glycosylase/8-oxoguanine DNA glycosylase